MHQRYSQALQDTLQPHAAAPANPDVRLEPSSSAPYIRKGCAQQRLQHAIRTDERTLRTGMEVVGSTVEEEMVQSEQWCAGAQDMRAAATAGQAGKGEEQPLNVWFQGPC